MITYTEIEKLKQERNPIVKKILNTYHKSLNEERNEARGYYKRTFTKKGKKVRLWN